MLLDFLVVSLLVLLLPGLWYAWVSVDGALKAQASLQAAQHAELLEALVRFQAKADAADARQMQRNSEQLEEILRSVMTDFQERISTALDVHVTRLAELAANTADLTGKHRSEQMEAMHHARRLADRMDGATHDFGKLIADNSAMLALAGQVRETLALLGTRQDASDSDVLRQSESINTLVKAVHELRDGFEQAIEAISQQTRRGLDALAQRQALGNSTLQKELNESLTKVVAGLSKQFPAMGPAVPTAMRGAR